MSMEKSAYTQQSESRSSFPFMKTVTKEGDNFSSKGHFYISPNGVLGVNDLHNANHKFNLEKEFALTQTLN
jgi:hypothetical protein